MHQVVYRLPIRIPGVADDGIPLYGFGLMLFVAFIACTWLAGRRAQREGISKDLIQDLAIWLFLGGLLGSRIAFLHLQGNVHALGDFLSQLPRIWDGGVIFYGAALGGIAGYALAWWFMIRKRQIPTLKLADIVAPSIAVGLCLGRLGCFLNGCCYGDVACPHCPAVSFPMSAPPRFKLVERGYQTAAGFTLARANPLTVSHVDPQSPAGKSGLRAGDVISAVDGEPIYSKAKLLKRLEDELHKEPDAVQPLVLGVRRDGQDVTLPPFRPKGFSDFELRDDLRVEAVEAGSPAALAGLAPGDVIDKVGEERADGSVDYRPLTDGQELSAHLGSYGTWRRGENKVRLAVLKPDNSEVALEFAPRTLGLHPTQLYESISMFLLFLALTAYYPFRRHDGEVMALLMIGYGIHRFLNEQLRGDDRPIGFERYSSEILFLAGVALLIWLLRKPAQYQGGVAVKTA